MKTQPHSSGLGPAVMSPTWPKTVMPNMNATRCPIECHRWLIYLTSSQSKVEHADI